MNLPLLKVKISPPPLRENLVLRPQLTEQLDQAFQRKLTLISAPAGFGKTTLIGMWLKNVSLPAAWFLLEDSDNEPLRFLEYLIAALQSVDPYLGSQTQARLQSSQPPTFDQLLGLLLNEILEYQSTLLIILDDYHLIQSSVIQNGLNFLLEHLPSNAHVIMATRSDPALPLSRLRGQGQVLELRTAQLRFTTQEVNNFLNQLMQLNLDPQQIELLEQHTEGWVSGLQMAALSLCGRSLDGVSEFITSFSASHRFILDYLLEEVLLQQTPELQRFMLQTSILNRLCAPLCQAVTGQSGSQAFLEDLETRNLFIFPLDNERGWYRYHALLADLLQKHLSQTGNDSIRELHLKASNWHQEHGLINDAIDHALLADQPERAADLIELSTKDGFTHGTFFPFQYWLKKMPDTLINKRPLLCIAAAWTEIMTSGHSISQGDEWMRRAKIALSCIDPDMKPAWYNLQTTGKSFNLTIHQIAASYQAAYQALTVGLRSSPDQSWVDKANDALKIIPDEYPVLRGVVFAQLGISQMTIGNLQSAMNAFDQAQRLGRSGGNSYGALLAVYIQSGIARLKGELQQAESLLRRELKSQFTQKNNIGRQSPTVGVIFAALGDIMRERGKLEAARDFLERGLEVCKPAAIGDLGIGTSQTIEEEGFILAAVSLARLRFASGEVFQDADLEALTKRCSPGLERYVKLHQVRLWLASPDLIPDGYQRAVHWAEGQVLSAADPIWDWEHEIPSLLTLVRVRLAQARMSSLPADHPEWQKILGFLKAQNQICLKRGWIERVIEIQILIALAYQGSAQIELALEALVEALMQASNKGYQRLFLDEGKLLQALIKQAVERGIAPKSARMLLLASSQKLHNLDKEQSTNSVTGLPLTRREIEVLELIAAGLTNAEICQELSIALGTVKRHTANINLKLDTHNRTQAVARARSLGILVKN